MKKIFFFAAILLGILIGGQVTPPPLATQTILAVTRQVPDQLIIPSINLNAHIEVLGKDSQGAMDVPKNIWDVGWYSPGPVPGKMGSAIIDGHLDSKTGAAVFANLSNLRLGDTIQVRNQNGNTKNFTIIQTAIYNNEVFHWLKYLGAPISRA